MQTSASVTHVIFAGLYLTGIRGFDPPQEVVDPPESSAEPLWGVDDSNPLRTPPPDSIFLLNHVQLYAAYASIETDVI